jgi:hypothetical protein
MNRRSRGASHPTCWWSQAARSSTSIAFTAKDLTMSYAALPCCPNTVHFPIRRRRVGLGSRFLCHFQGTAPNRRRVSQAPRVWQFLHRHPGRHPFRTGGPTGIAPNWILILFLCEGLSALPEKACETRLSGARSRHLHCLLCHQAPGRDSVHRGLQASRGRATAPRGSREEAN